MQAVELPMLKPITTIDMTTFLQHLLTQGHFIEAIKTDDVWLECDNMNDVRVYEEI